MKTPSNSIIEEYQLNIVINHVMEDEGVPLIDIVNNIIKEYELAIETEFYGRHVWRIATNIELLEELRVICYLVNLEVSKTQLSVLTNTPFITIFR